VCKVESLTAFYESIVWPCGILAISHPHRPPWPVTWIAILSFVVVFIVCNVSFIVCVTLFVVFCLRVCDILCDMCILYCPIVVPLPPGKHRWDNINLSVCLINWAPCNEEVWSGGKAPTLSTSALYVGEWSDSYHGPRKHSPWVSWVGIRTGLHAVK
jgi:hypothetical protein